MLCLVHFTHAMHLNDYHMDWCQVRKFQSSLERTTDNFLKCSCYSQQRTY